MNAVVNTTSQTASVRAAIASKRETIESLAADLDELESGYLPAAEVAQRFSDQVDREAAKFSAEYLLSPHLRYNGKTSVCDIFQISTRPGVYSHTVDNGPMLAFLFGEQLKTRIAEYRETLDCPDGPPSADRPALIKKLKAKIHAAEVAEEHLIVEAEKNGIDVCRHPDASPEVILEWKGGV